VLFQSVEDTTSTNRAPTIMKTKLIVSTLSLALMCTVIASASAQSPTPSSGKKPNILVIFGDDIGQTNISAYSFGLMGYKTPNIAIGVNDAFISTFATRRPAIGTLRRI